ncbi:MAG: Amidohydrolase [Ignavibacteria bacterium]|nr:MAG: Amidohydrolase [Ignavibacteria bacterium]KAF0159130.1 MAG: Amidohydrolase [Ignavibacteria bacterium]
MKNNLTIENAWICSVVETEVIPFFGDLLITSGIISKIRPKNFFSFLKNPTRVGKDSYNAFGRVLTIPNVNFHDHIYSRLAKGLPLKGKFDSFQNVLKNLWWKLDRALDRDMIKASAQAAAIDSIQNGVTYIFDHHSSQSEIKNSLNVIKNVLDDFSLRGVLCFETTDRNSSSSAVDGLSENVSFLNDANENFKAMLGLHASFTISDETLLEAKKVLGKNWGIHIHVAEDESDNRLSMEYSGALPVSRLKKYKLMNDKSILVHGVHLQQKDYLKIIEADSAIAFCLDSNMNNSVGMPQFTKIPNPIPLLIGTDGMHSNIARSFKQLFLISRNQGMSSEQSFSLIKKIYFDQNNFVKKYFNDFTSLMEKERADFIVWDYVPPTPINKENFWGHFIYGILEARILSVVQKGKFLMKNFQYINEEIEEVRSQIFQEGERLYNKLK